MFRNPAVFWGPPFRWAIIPVAAVGAVVAAVLVDHGPGDDVDPPVAVTALKPLSADDPGATMSVAPDSEGVVEGERMPIEVRYGVPSSATVFLWTDRHQAARG